MIGIRLRRTVEVPCTLDIAQTPETLHAHAIPEGIEIHPGDVVIVHDAPARVGFGERILRPGRATVVRAGWTRRRLTRLAALFQLADLYEVGFLPRETP